MGMLEAHAYINIASAGSGSRNPGTVGWLGNRAIPSSMTFFRRFSTTARRSFFLVFARRDRG